MKHVSAASHCQDGVTILMNQEKMKLDMSFVSKLKENVFNLSAQIHLAIKTNKPNIGTITMTAASFFRSIQPRNLSNTPKKSFSGLLDCFDVLI